MSARLPVLQPLDVGEDVQPGLRVHPALVEQRRHLGERRVLELVQPRGEQVVDGVGGLLVPFVGAAASSIVFGERFGPLRLAGMIVVIVGIAIMLLSGRSRSIPKIA